MGALHLFDPDSRTVRSVVRVVNGEAVIDSGGEPDLEWLMRVRVKDGHRLLTQKDGDDWLRALAEHLQTYICGEYVP